MPLPRGTACNVCYVAFDYSLNRGRTGDAPNHTLKLIRDGSEFSPTNSPTEVDATNCPGLYQLSLTANEMDSTIIEIAGKSSSSDVSIIPTKLITD